MTSGSNVRNIEDIYPLSPMQQGMLFHSLYTPETSVYIEQLRCKLEGSLNQGAFERAWQEVVRRHSILRTGFTWEELEEPLQVVHRNTGFSIKWVDFSGYSLSEAKGHIDHLVADEINEKFDLSEPPLMRLVMVKLPLSQPVSVNTGLETSDGIVDMRQVTDQHSYQLIWSYHHLLLDGWSMPILLREVFSLYEAYNLDQDLYIKPAKPYRDYIGWLQKQDLSKAAEHWQNYLKDFSSPTLISSQLGKYMVKSEPPRGLYDETGEVHIIRKNLSIDTTRALRRISQQYGITLNSIVQGLWAVLLSRYCAEDDILFGATVAGRPASLPDAESILGLFINTLPVRARVDPWRPVIEWLKDLQTEQAATRQFEYTPLVQVQGWSEIHNQATLFDSILVFENYPVETNLTQQRGSLSIRDVEHYGKTNYPLTVVFAPSAQLSVEMVYDPQLIDEDHVSRISSHFINLVEGFSAHPDKLLGDLELLDSSEKQSLLDQWSMSPDHLAFELLIDHTSVFDLIEKHAQEYLDSTAAIFVKSGSNPSDSTRDYLSYRELLTRVDVLSRYLQTIGVKRGVLVGIYLERSFEMLVALLAVSKSGGAYVPLDPKSPQERTIFMIEDAEIKVLLTQNDLATRLNRSDDVSQLIKVLRLDVDWEQIQDEGEVRTVDSGAAASEYEGCTRNITDPVYVIYTSGTTGSPKGVVVTHRSLVNHAVTMAEKLALSPGNRMAQLLSISFDAAGEEIYPTLINGGTLVLPDAFFDMSGWAILNLCDQERVTHLHLTAAIWHQCVDELVGGRKVPESLKTLLVGGESPSVGRLRIWSKGAEKPVNFLNAYGPTEATITSTVFQKEVGSGANWFEGFDQIPIGRPIAGAQVLILDSNFRLAPVGVPGEIHIGGVGVAREYLKRPDLTKEKFIPNPFSNQSLDPLIGEERLYRTGDRGLYLPDGNILFLGRMDYQVKLRGYRIELEEIEAVFRSHPQVLGAVVLLREDRPGDKHLAAYLTLSKGKNNEDADLGISTLRDFLASRLPDYMIPAAIVILDEIPLTSSGKVDRKALPVPDIGHRFVPDLEKVLPRDGIEEILAGLWAEVLGIETSHKTRLGVFENFFELGGHSLKATQLLSRIRQTMEVEISLRSLFESPTIAEMARLVRISLKGGTVTPDAITPLPRNLLTGLPKQPARLSFAQQRLWFLDQLDPGNLSYIIPMAIRITGELDYAALHSALNQVIQRHEALRTSFETHDGKPVQLIQSSLILDIPITDISSLRAEDDRNAVEQDEVLIKQWIQRQVRQPFNLITGPLVRAALLLSKDRAKDNQTREHIFVLSIHHIVTDGWSMGILINETIQNYAGQVMRQPVTLPELQIQYADYSEWQRDWLKDDELDRQLDYWTKVLSGSPPLLDLPTDRPRPALKTSHGGIEGFVFSSELSKAIQDLARRENVTVYMLLLAAFQTLLYRYSGQDDISFGSVIANRVRPEIESLIGFFVNTLVLRTDLSGNPDFRELLQRVREVALGAFAHQDLPFEMLVEALQPERNLSYTPLFQVGFDWQESPVKTVELPGLKIEPLKSHGGSAAFDLLMEINQSQDVLGGTLEFNTDLFDIETIQRLLDHYIRLIDTLVQNPDLKIADVSFLTESEKQKILLEWNATETEFSEDRCIHELFEGHAAIRNDQLALIYQGANEVDVQKMTYGELNRRSNILARYLQSMGVSRDGLVAISMERSLEMIVGILGVLKAGGAYLPLDPNYPPERLAFMVADAQTPILITQDKVYERHRPHLVADYVIRLDSEWDRIEADVTARVGEEAGNNLTTSTDPENLAYVIYTSGSTGKPKGTLLRHRGLCNLVEWQRRTFNITQESRVLQFSPFSFDASVWETFMALANGATLCLANQETLTSGYDLVRVLREHAVTTITLPPSVLSVLPTDQINISELPALHTVIAAGEACSREIVMKWAPGRNFYNAYGPTETTVCATCALCDVNELTNPPIGRPIANTRLYVLDQNRNPTPIGVPGELYIAGIGLAKGYLNRPEMTGEKFLPNPLSNVLRKMGKPEHGSEGLYRTGDLVRYRPDGNLEFLGRIDEQVKVRGFRIELGEIEAMLRQINEEIPENPGYYLRLQDVAVILRDEKTGEKRLAAFVVLDNSRKKTEDERAKNQESGNQKISEVTLIRILRQYLRKSLPEYMVPATFVILDALPLSPSGKVDRRALALKSITGGGRDQLETAYEPPRTETEKQLCRICASLLGIESTGEQSPVGIHDNFFELGGHSLLATQFISRIRENFLVEIPLRTLFERPTVAELSVAVDLASQNATVAQIPSIRSVSRESRRMRQTTSGLETLLPPAGPEAAGPDTERDHPS